MLAWVPAAVRIRVTRAVRPEVEVVPDEHGLLHADSTERDCERDLLGPAKVEGPTERQCYIHPARCPERQADAENFGRVCDYGFVVFAEVERPQKHGEYHGCKQRVCCQPLEQQHYRFALVALLLGHKLYSNLPRLPLRVRLIRL